MGKEVLAWYELVRKEFWDPRWLARFNLAVARGPMTPFMTMTDHGLRAEMRRGLDELDRIIREITAGGTA